MPEMLSLFSGGGLADLGCAAAGYTAVGAVEWDEAIAAVYAANHASPVTVASVQSVDYRQYAGIDLLWASPCCKNASVAKRHGDAGEAPEDLEAAEGVTRCINETMPRAFALENVWRYRTFTAFRRILETLDARGYRWRFEHLNSADYGVPQTRQRLILRARRDGAPVGPLAPTHTEGGCDGGMFAEHALLPWIGWYAAVEDLIPSLPKTELARWQQERLPEVWGGESVLVQREPGARGDSRRPGEPAKTVTPCDTRLRAVLVESRNRNSIQYRGGEDPDFTVTAARRMADIPRAVLERRVVQLTPRCLARFQSMPDSYALPERAAAACRVIGNGVPCLLARRVAESLR